MNNLLFTALCLALIYYFFFYLPTPKKANQPFKHQETQTQKEVENKAVQTELDEKDEQIKELKKELELDKKVLESLLKEFKELTEQLN